MKHGKPIKLKDKTMSKEQNAFDFRSFEGKQSLIEGNKKLKVIQLMVDCVDG